MALTQKIKAIIAAQLDRDISEIKGEASLVDDLGADSLDIVELVMAMEEEFEIEIPDEAIEKIQSVQDVVHYLRKHVGDEADELLG